eukprot:1718692-Pleurochrysis_carterae.AAC.1
MHSGNKLLLNYSIEFITLFVHTFPLTCSLNETYEDKHKSTASPHSVHAGQCINAHKVMFSFVRCCAHASKAKQQG